MVVDPVLMGDGDVAGVVDVVVVVVLVESEEVVAVKTVVVVAVVADTFVVVNVVVSSHDTFSPVSLRVPLKSRNALLSTAQLEDRQTMAIREFELPAL